VAPPVAEQLEELRGQHDVPVLFPLALLHAQDHPPAIDGGDRQANGFADAQAGRVAGGENHPVIGQVDAVEEVDDFVRAEHDRERLGSAGDRQHLSGIPLAAQRDVVKEPQGGDRDDDRLRRQPALVSQIQLVAADLVGAEMIRGLAEVAGKAGDLLDVRRLRVRREIPEAHVLCVLLERRRQLERNADLVIVPDVGDLEPIGPIRNHRYPRDDGTRDGIRLAA
jgi:hypothetical protein